MKNKRISIKKKRQLLNQNCCLLPDDRFRRCRQIYWRPTNFLISLTAVVARVRPNESITMPTDDPTISTARFFIRSNTVGWMTGGTKRRISRRFLNWRRRAIECGRVMPSVFCSSTYFFLEPVFPLVERAIISSFHQQSKIDAKMLYANHRGIRRRRVEVAPN